MSTDQGSYISEGNAYYNDLVADASFNGSFDDMTNFNMVRVWVNTPDEALLRIHYADSSAGDNEQIELFGLYPGNHSSIHNLKKADFARVSLTNTAGVQQSDVLVRTKFAERIPHPFLNYTNDNVNVNARLSLDEFRVSTLIDHETSDILVYGSDGTDSYPIKVDAEGKLLVTGNTETNIPGQNVLLVGGLSDGTDARIFNVNDDGNLFTESNLLVNDQRISAANPLPIQFNSIEVLQDTSADLQTQAHLMVRGNAVADGNRIPVELDTIEVTQDISANLQTEAHLMVGGNGVTDVNRVPVDIDVVEVTQDTPANLKTEAHLMVNNSAVSDLNPVSVSLDNIEVIQDTPADLQTQAHLMVGGTEVDALNPVPVTMTSVEVTQDTPSDLQVEANLMVNNDAVGLLNPVPVQLDNSKFTVVQDTPSELQTQAHLIVDSQEVNDTNQVPVKRPMTSNLVFSNQVVNTGVITSSIQDVNGELLTILGNVTNSSGAFTITIKGTYDGTNNFDMMVLDVTDGGDFYHSFTAAVPQIIIEANGGALDDSITLWFASR